MKKLVLNSLVWPTFWDLFVTLGKMSNYFHDLVVEIWGEICNNTASSYWGENNYICNYICVYVICMYPLMREVNSKYSKSNHKEIENWALSETVNMTSILDENVIDLNNYLIQLHCFSWITWRAIAHWVLWISEYANKHVAGIMYCSLFDKCSLVWFVCNASYLRQIGCILQNSEIVLECYLSMWFAKSLGNVLNHFLLNRLKLNRFLCSSIK